MIQFGSEILGGVMIGVASALPMIFFGRIAGVSGLAASATRPKAPEGRGALFFIVGLGASAVLWLAMGGQTPSASLAQASGVVVWAVAGLLVGFGSRLGGGCTSGHGVCGMGRLSVRSLVATAVFLVVAIGVATLWSRL